MRMSLSSDMTGHLGTPMKETGGLSQPPRSLNHPNKTKQQNKTNMGSNLKQDKLFKKSLVGLKVQWREGPAWPADW